MLDGIISSGTEKDSTKGIKWGLIFLIRMSKAALMFLNADGAKYPASKTAPQSSIKDFRATILARSTRIGLMLLSLNGYCSI